MAFQLWSYSGQQLDYLIIAISSAGIYIVFQTLQFSLEKHRLYNLYQLKCAGAIFICAIIFNFISQLTGRWANEHDLKFRRLILDSSVGNDIFNGERMKVEDKKADKYTSWTEVLNWLSIAFMIFGLLIEIIYFIYNL